MQDTLTFNGINARTGSYLLPELSSDDLARIARGERLDDANLAELKFRARRAGESHFGVKEGIDARKLEETGWGVVFPFVAPNSAEAKRQDAIRDALNPLLEHRRAQANRKHEYYREYRGTQAYRPGDTKQKFLARLGAGPGPADPAKVPYYLLIIGSPEEVPFNVQYQIDVQYAVGRVHFDTVEEYANYAQSVVRAETSGLSLPRQAAFFGVSNADDRATQMSAKHLVTPLIDALGASAGLSNWALTRHMGEAATKAQLGRLLGGSETPAVLFTASHGIGFPKGDPLQERHQGALLCQDWPGPKQWQKKIPSDFYFSADDVASDASLLGLIAFNFACYGAGTPDRDEFSKQAFKERSVIAERPFVAALQRRLLGHPKGGALAAIGHVERAWGHSFMWEGGPGRSAATAQLAVFESTMSRLMDGYPVGAAVEYFNERYAELASDLSERLEAIEYGSQCDAYELAGMWTANNDARAYAVIGDPAVKLMTAEDGARKVSRDQLTVTTLRSPSVDATNAAAPEQAAAAPISAPQAESFGMFGGDPGKDTAAPSGMQQFLTKVLSTLGEAVQNAATLQVRTYVSTDLDALAKSGNVALSEQAQLRAYTRIAPGGDMDVCVPAKDGRVDTELWQLHAELVKHAQAQRTELMNTMFSAISKFIKP